MFKPAFAAALAAVISLAATAPVSAGPAEDRGLEIAKEGDARGIGWGDSTVTAVMTLRNKAGQTSVRRMRVKALEIQSDGDKGIVVFDEPKDIRGTALLTHSHKTADDDQWLYLPAVKRVKRIASRNKSGPFMGSEFAYEDLSSQEVEKYTYKYLRDEACGAWKCFVVERYPTDENSGYTSQITWIDQDEYRPVKVEYYDRKKSLLKTLATEGWNEYLDQYWRPDEMTMVNHQTGKSTTMEWTDYLFGQGLEDRDFTDGSLKRIR